MRTRKNEHLFSALLRELALEAEERGQLVGDGVGDAGVDVNRDLLDPLRSFFGDFFDVDAAIGGGDENGAVGLSVHQDTEVGFPGDVDGFGDHDLGWGNQNKTHYKMRMKEILLNQGIMKN